MKANTPEIIMAKLVRTDTGCWEWPGSVIWNGYAVTTIRRKYRPVHRIVYEHVVGPIPEGYDLHHLCENRRCAEPTHLEPLSRREHVRLGRSIVAQQMARTHCVNGHPLAGENLRADTSGRRCRICHNAANRRYYHRCVDR